MTDTEKTIQLVIVTGMSGAGKTVAIQSFEDMGYFTIDNMPPALLPKFIELIQLSMDNNKLALVVDMRSRSFFAEIRSILDELENHEGIDFKILFWMRPIVNWLLATKRLVVAIHWLLMGVSWMGLHWNGNFWLHLKT